MLFQQSNNQIPGGLETSRPIWCRISLTNQRLFCPGSLNLSLETRGKTASDWEKTSNTRWVCLFPTLLVFDYYSVAITLNMGDNLVPVKIRQTRVIITFTWQPTWFIPIGNKWAQDIFQRCQYLYFCVEILTNAAGCDTIVLGCFLAFKTCN